MLAPEQARIALFRISTLGRCQEENTQSDEVPRNAVCSVLAETSRVPALVAETDVKADAKARAKAEVDASCRDTQAQALARLMLWSEKSRLNSAGIFGWQCF